MSHANDSQYSNKSLGEFTNALAFIAIDKAKQLRLRSGIKAY